ncbi:MAG: hypothetical protein II362_01875 [Alistipes sp.]|nr:hypothetical protein [Alistipes sp.]
MQRVLRIVLVVLLWVLVAFYVVYATRLARHKRAERRLTSIEIVLADSTADGSLLTAQRVEGWLRRSNIRLDGRQIDSIDLAAIERLVARNGFVERVEAGVTSDGRLRITLSQHQPIVRLLCGGMNGYSTPEGYLFATPPRSALYVPVVTGTYSPPVPRTYEGLVRDHIDRQKERLDSLIARVEVEKYPFLKAEIANDKKIDSVRAVRIKRRWWAGETKEIFEKKVEETRAKKAAARRYFDYRGRLIQADLDRLAERQEGYRRQQKKLEKNYEDFAKLLTFVEELEGLDFWRSEVVEIEAKTAHSGELELTLIPRSGRFEIRFGRLEQTAEKFARLEHFYREGLTKLGWERYRVVDVRYSDRVVCQ